MAKKKQQKSSSSKSKAQSGNQTRSKTPAPSASTLLPALFTLAALFAAVWAWFLIGVHYDAVDQANAVGSAANGATSFFVCGEGEACSQVLADEAAELFGVIPVSIPAIPMFGLLALLGLGVLRGRFDRDRLASLAVFCGSLGLAFGAYLLSIMLLHYGPCRFCLIMDAGTLAVFLLGGALHSGGILGALKSVGGLFGRVKTPGPEMALAPLVLIATIAIHGMTTPSESQPTQLTTASSPANTAASDTAAGAVNSGSDNAATIRPADSEAISGSTEAPEATTRRVVLQAERKDIPIDASVPTKGPKDAAVTLVLFEDFQCPYCKKLSGNIEQLLEDPEIAKDTRVAYMHFPMHKSCNAADLKKSMHKFACSSAAVVGATMVTNPLDVLKVRLQAPGAPPGPIKGGTEVPGTWGRVELTPPDGRGAVSCVCGGMRRCGLCWR